MRPNLERLGEEASGPLFLWSDMLVDWQHRWLFIICMIKAMEQPDGCSNCSVRLAQRWLGEREDLTDEKIENKKALVQMYEREKKCKHVSPLTLFCFYFCRYISLKIQVDASPLQKVWSFLKKLKIWSSKLRSQIVLNLLILWITVGSNFQCLCD